jgi:hypothetical protein
MMEAVAKKIADLAEGRESVKQRGSDEGVAPLFTFFQVMRPSAVLWRSTMPLSSSSAMAHAMRTSSGSSTTCLPRVSKLFRISVIRAQAVVGNQSSGT